MHRCLNLDVTGNNDDVSTDPHVSPDQPAYAPPPKSAVKFTRTAATWWALIVGLLILVILLVFIAQNTEHVSLQFLGWEWSVPLAVTILVAAVSGAVIMVLTGAARMFQLRRAAKKNLLAR